MSNKEYHLIRKTLLLKNAGFTNKEISRILGINKKKVRKYSKMSLIDAFFLRDDMQSALSSHLR